MGLNDWILEIEVGNGAVLQRSRLPREENGGENLRLRTEERLGTVVDMAWVQRGFAAIFIRDKRTKQTSLRMRWWAF